MLVVESVVLCDCGGMVLESLESFGPHAHHHFASEAEVGFLVREPDMLCDLTSDVKTFQSRLKGK